MATGDPVCRGAGPSCALLTCIMNLPTSPARGRGGVGIPPQGGCSWLVSIHSPFLWMPLDFLWWRFRDHEGKGGSAQLGSARLCRCSAVAVALKGSHLKEVPGSKPSGT